MPMNSAQLAILVERARQQPPHAVTTPPQPPRPATAVAVQAVLPAVLPLPKTADRYAQDTAEADDFPTGWHLAKESWHFHRRFYAVFRRPMARGEYSHLLWQIRRGKAEHLGEDCGRVTLPGGRRTLAVRGTVWRLITILPKNWQPPMAEVEATARCPDCAPSQT